MTTINLDLYPIKVRAAVEACLAANPGDWEIDEDVVWEMQETDGYVDGQVNFYKKSPKPGLYSSGHTMMVRFMENVPDEEPTFKILADDGENIRPDTVEELIEIFNKLT